LKRGRDRSRPFHLCIKFLLRAFKNAAILKEILQFIDKRLGNGAADGSHQRGGAGDGGLAGDRGQDLFAELPCGDPTGCRTNAGKVDGDEFLDQMRPFDSKCLFENNLNLLSHL
jgi:hypothetical protein